MLKESARLAKVSGINWTEIEESLDQNPAKIDSLLTMVGAGAELLVLPKVAARKSSIMGDYDESRYTVVDAAEIFSDQFLSFDAADKRSRELGVDFIDEANFKRLFEYKPELTSVDTWAGKNLNDVMVQFF